MMMMVALSATPCGAWMLPHPKSPVTTIYRMSSSSDLANKVISALESTGDDMNRRDGELLEMLEEMSQSFRQLAATGLPKKQSPPGIAAASPKDQDLKKLVLQTLAVREIARPDKQVRVSRPPVLADIRPAPKASSAAIVAPAKDQDLKAFVLKALTIPEMARPDRK